MGLFQNLKGIIGNILVLGKEQNAALKNNSGIIEARNGADDDFVALRAKRLASGFGLNDIATAIDLKGIVPLIEFSFSGSSAPSAGANTAKFGFCHTSGGSYNAGDVIYDDGTTLLKIQAVAGVMTTTSVSGAVSLVANGMYAKQGSSYVLKGDGSGATTGIVQVVELTLAHNSSATVDSTTSIPANAVINRVECLVVTPFNGTTPTLAVAVNGSTPLAILETTDSDLKTANQYQSMELKTVGATNTGVVRLNYVASSSSAGSAKIYVFYVTPLA